jgi:DNA gyrase subunit A
MSEPFSFSEEQANHILDMTLGRLTRLGRSELETEMAQLKATIEQLEAILGDPFRLRAVISTELESIKQQHAQPRRTRVIHDPGELFVEDLIEDEELVVTLTRAGYIKAVQADAFRAQARGGRGVQGTRLKEEDLIDQVLHTTAHSHLLLFSNRGKVYRLRAHEVPVKERNARGTPIVNLLPLEPAESIQAIVETRTFEYDKSRREGFIAINLNEGDELVRVVRTGGGDDLLMVSKHGTAIRFAESEVRPMGRSAAGVRGMRLRTGDEVVSCDVARDGVDLLIVTDAGYGKRTKLDHFNAQTRGGQGVRGIKLTQRRGAVVSALMASLEDEIIVVSSAGVMIRTSVRQIAAQGRDATGVRVMNLDEGQTVAAVTKVPQETEAAGAQSRLPIV